MTIDEAEKIIQDFGQVHEIASVVGLAIPEQFLPYPKEKIKEAFQYAFKLTDDDGKERLKGAYIYIPTYVPIADAVNVVRYTNYLTKEKNAHEEDASLREEWQKIMNRINKEMEDYSRELK